MKFVTFNLRCDWAQDGANCFVYRQPLILKTIVQEMPDVIGFQEVLPHMAAWLKQNLADYCIVGCGRGTALDDEQMSVAFLRDRYNLVSMNTFWLSETPLVPGSRYQEQSSCPRTCTEVVLCEVETGRVLRILNTHLDHKGAGARRLGLMQILRYLEKAELFPDAPVILMGDFNASPDSEEMTAFNDFPGYVNATKDIGITFHGYMKANPPEYIDYIYLKGCIVCNHIEKWQHTENGVYLSDHYPICAELSWNIPAPI